MFRVCTFGTSYIAKEVGKFFTLIRVQTSIFAEPSRHGILSLQNNPGDSFSTLAIPAMRREDAALVTYVVRPTQRPSLR